MRDWLRTVFSGSVLIALLLAPPPTSAWFADPGQVPVRRSLPDVLDLMESGLYWLQDLRGVAEPRDPASLVRLMEDQAARFFDLAYMAYQVAGPRYVQMDLLQRSHFQNRVRDRLFEMLARQVGLYDVRMPRLRPLVPRYTGMTTGQVGGVFYHSGGPIIQLTFEFYLTPYGWRIYDVTSNGVSAISVLRRDYHDNALPRY